MGIVAAVAAAVGTGYSIYSGERAASAQENAQGQAKANADKQAAAADQAQNRANQKHPDVSSILSAASQAGRAGESGTMLTGPAGVDASTLKLGKNTLLGQ
jgi:type II secretory pathway pseudopilin PulG